MTNKIKGNVKIDLDQLKTLILIKCGQKRVGSLLPSLSVSHNPISYVSSTSVLGVAHYLLTVQFTDFEQSVLVPTNELWKASTLGLGDFSIDELKKDISSADAKFTRVSN
jgi:hypothetical protein